MQNKEKKIKISGRIYGVFYSLTRQKKEKMAVIYLEHPDGLPMIGIYKALLFPRSFRKFSKYIKLDTCVQVEGTKSSSESEQIIIHNLSRVISKN